MKTSKMVRWSRCCRRPLVAALAGVMLLSLLSPSYAQLLRRPRRTPGQAPDASTGVTGSPSATTTIDGRQLPPLDPKFGGVIRENAAQSKPWWPPRVVPPKGAPNVLLIMTDDVGFAAPSTFGG